MSTSLVSGGIRARDESEFSRNPTLKNAENYGAWCVKLESILDSEECWEIVIGIELEPIDLEPAAVVMIPNAEGGEVENNPSAADVLLITARKKDIKEYKRRYKRAVSLITRSVDDSLVQALSVYEKDPHRIWMALEADFNTVTSAKLSLARQNFMSFRILDDESFLDIKHRFEELVRKVVQQKGILTVDDKLQVLVCGLPERYDILRESFFGMRPAPDIDYMWSRLDDIGSTQKQRESEEEVMRGEANY